MRTDRLVNNITKENLKKNTNLLANNRNDCLTATPATPRAALTNTDLKVAFEYKKATACQIPNDSILV